MNDNKMGEIIKASVEGIKNFAEMDTVVGKPIVTENLTVIPVSKVSVSFASGGVDFFPKKTPTQSFGGGGGTSITVTPLAFLALKSDASINLITLDKPSNKETFGALGSITDRFPDIIEKLKSLMS